MDYMNSVMPSDKCLARIFTAKGISYDLAERALELSLAFAKRALTVLNSKGFEL